MENLELEQQLEKAKTGSGADEEMREPRQQSRAGSGIDPVTGLPSEPGCKTRHKSDTKGGSGPGETFDGQKQPGAELGSTHVVKGHVSGAEDPLDYPERTDPVTGLPLGQQDEEYAGNDGSAQRPSQDASRVTGQAPVHQRSASKVASGTGETFDPNSEARKESGDTGASIGRGSKQSGNGGRVSGGPPFERDSESRKNSRYGETFDPNKEATQRGGSGTPGSRRESYFDKLAQKHRQSVNSGDGKAEGGMKSNMDGTKGKTCCGAGIHGGSGEGRSLNDKTIEQIKTELEASSRRNPVHVRCGSLHCDCAYHYLKEGKLYCIRTKKKSLNKETDIVSSKVNIPVLMYHQHVNNLALMCRPQVENPVLKHHQHVNNLALMHRPQVENPALMRHRHVNNLALMQRPQVENPALMRHRHVNNLALMHRPQVENPVLKHHQGENKQLKIY